MQVRGHTDTHREAMKTALSRGERQMTVPLCSQHRTAKATCVSSVMLRAQAPFVAFYSTGTVLKPSPKLSQSSICSRAHLLQEKLDNNPCLFLGAAAGRWLSSTWPVQCLLCLSRGTVCSCHFRRAASTEGNNLTLPGLQRLVCTVWATVLKLCCHARECLNF